MPALAFDTHAYVKKLRDAGVPEAQAEIQLEAIVAILEKRIATKDDLELRKTELRSYIKELDVKLEREIAEVKRDIKKLDVKLEREIAGVKRDIKELDVKLETGLRELEVKLETGLRELGVKLEREIAGVKRDIKELEMRLLLRLGALLTVAVGAIAALVKLL